MTDYNVDFDGEHFFITLRETSKHHTNIRKGLLYQEAYALASELNKLISLFDQKRETQP